MKPKGQLNGEWFGVTDSLVRLLNKMRREGEVEGIIGKGEFDLVGQKRRKLRD
jgi:hypothetical protein